MSDVKQFYDVVVVGAGPAGSAAAIHAADAGLSVLLVESGSAGRDKTCGDGLTPRAMHELRALGLADAITARVTHRGLKLHGYGASVEAPWPVSEFGTVSSAMPRTLFDDYLARTAATRGAEVLYDTPITDVTLEGGRLASVNAGEQRFSARWFVIADGVRSVVGKQLGRTWHRDEVYGIAARSYAATPRSREPWLHSHVELRDDNTIQPGYGWIFPLGDGTVNLGCGALSTEAKPARINTKKLLHTYAAAQREEWQLGDVTKVTSALLPMGGAVSNVAGPNWMLIGDAAAGVNPLNGEGIDYGLEMARLAISLTQAGYRDLTEVWPRVLRHTYGEAFALARTAARLLTHPRFLPAVGPIAMRSSLMPAAARLMANLITDEDRDFVARAWRLAGRGVSTVRGDVPLWG